MSQAPDVVKKALHAQFIGRCDVMEYRPYTKPNKTTGRQEVVVHTGLPCRLSISSHAAASADGMTVRKAQTATLFLAAETEIAPGSKLVVTQNGKTTAYKHSGESAVLGTHQEILLELFEGYT